MQIDDQRNQSQCQNGAQNKNNPGSHAHPARIYPQQMLCVRKLLLNLIRLLRLLRLPLAFDSVYGVNGHMQCLTDWSRCLDVRIFCLAAQKLRDGVDRYA